ncbi:hypothetical protein DEI92_02575 [Curtobacterium sp. MCBD17_034]|nr:hypothetical protein DEI92_02575 [Curtobacterium sp. MCBD17_034]PZM39900.1 hypothetical protein DEI90_03530 [Curtobacterium sp. MCBD17_031]
MTLVLGLILIPFSSLLWLFSSGDWRRWLGDDTLQLMLSAVILLAAIWSIGFADRRLKKARDTLSVRATP